MQLLSVHLAGCTRLETTELPGAHTAHYQWGFFTPELSVGTSLPGWCTVLLPVAQAQLPLDHRHGHCLASQEWREGSKDLEPSQPQLLCSPCAVPVCCGKAAAWNRVTVLPSAMGMCLVEITCGYLPAVTGSKTSVS